MDNVPLFTIFMTIDESEYTHEHTPIPISSPQPTTLRNLTQPQPRSLSLSASQPLRLSLVPALSLSPSLCLSLANRTSAMSAPTSRSRARPSPSSPAFRLPLLTAIRLRRWSSPPFHHPLCSRRAYRRSVSFRIFAYLGSWFSGTPPSSSQRAYAATMATRDPARGSGGGGWSGIVGSLKRRCIGRESNPFQIPNDKCQMLLRY
eukprot:scaffold58993_cov34-Tisochrysis_lutea.AAC.1